MSPIVRGIDESQLTAPTPCTEYDVRALLNHLLFWGPSLVGAGHKDPVPPPAEDEADVDLTGGDWAKAVERNLEGLVGAWSRPEAWEGTTRMVSPDGVPASMIGGMVLSELVVHGWDLARASGQVPVWNDALLNRVYAELTEMASMGREMGAYGPEVPVAESAPTLDRIVALTGRDPSWKP